MYLYLFFFNKHSVPLFLIFQPTRQQGKIPVGKFPGPEYGANDIILRMASLEDMRNGCCNLIYFLV